MQLRRRSHFVRTVIVLGAVIALTSLAIAGRASVGPFRALASASHTGVLADSSSTNPQILTSESPEASETPDASETPEATETPDASETPEASDTPDASETPKPSDSPDAEGQQGQHSDHESQTGADHENGGDHGGDGGGGGSGDSGGGSGGGD